MMNASVRCDRSTRDGEGTIIRQQEETVKKFASLLGSKTGVTGPHDETSQQRGNELCKLLSESLLNSDVVLTLPSFEVPMDEEKNNPMPQVGETAGSMNMETDRQDEEQSSNKPPMAASVLEGTLTVAADIETKAAQGMGTLSSWTKSTLQYTSQAVASNLSRSFSSLVDSRIRSWTMLLLRHSLSSGDQESRSRLLNILKTSVKMESTETNFRTLPLPESASNQPKEADVILPLLFEVVLKIKLQKKTETVTVRAPGTIAAYFMDPSLPTGLRSVEIALDSSAMLRTMVDQARIIVFRAVASAINTSTSKVDSADLGGEISTEKTQGLIPTMMPPTLSGFRSILSISTAPADDVAPLQKARASALRLSSVLEGRKDLSDPAHTGMRKNVSVHWNTPATIPQLSGPLAPNPLKKQRMAQTAAKLKSFKSFGRPHAGDFGSGPRNATFGDYGRQVTWGRNNRMVAPPIPMAAMGASFFNNGDMLVPEKNATFDMSPHLSRSPQTPSPAPSIPRTATALESLLLRKATSGSDTSRKG